MPIFLALIAKIIPLYVLIFMGYIAARFLHSHRDTIAHLLFYMLTPLVIFNGVLHTHLDSNVFMMPVISFLIASLLCLVFYGLSTFVWEDSTKNLMAISAGSGNTGYFGLPIVLLLLNDQGEGIYIMAMLGVTLYESTVGFYFLAKGSYTAKECLQKLARLPSLYSFMIALAINLAGFKPPEAFAEFSGYIKGAFTVLGMMLVGLSLGGTHRFKVDYKFIGMTFLAKFIAWPLIALGIIYFDSHWLHYLNGTIYNALFILSIVPLAANTVALAAILKNQPEKSATAVFLSTLFAIIYVPLMIAWLYEAHL